MANAQAANGESVTLELREHVLDDVDEAVERGHYDDREHALTDAVQGFFGGYQD